MGNSNLAQPVVAPPVKGITMTDMMPRKFCITHAPMVSPWPAISGSSQFFRNMNSVKPVKVGLTKVNWNVRDYWIFQSHLSVIRWEVFGHEAGCLGHKHYGQLSLPFIGPLWAPADAPPFEHCSLDEGSNVTVLVTSGVGTSILPLRFSA